MLTSFFFLNSLVPFQLCTDAVHIFLATDTIQYCGCTGNFVSMHVP